MRENIIAGDAPNSRSTPSTALRKIGMPKFSVASCAT